MRANGDKIRGREVILRRYVEDFMEKIFGK